jgi:hypothetical protein
MQTIEEVISRLLLNTKRNKRRDNMIVIANDIIWLKEELGGLKNVSDLVGISPGMLNRFLSVNKLTDKLKLLVEERRIDKVSEVNSLSKFKLEEQDIIAELLITKKLSNQDLKILPPLRKRYPHEDITSLSEKIKNSANKKIYVINFYLGDLNKDKEYFKIYLDNLLNHKELIDLVYFNNIGSIKITKEGEKILRTKAKEKHLSFKEFINTILQ